MDRNVINIQLLVIVKCLEYVFATLKKRKTQDTKFISAIIHVVFFHLFIFVLKTGAFNNA